MDREVDGDPVAVRELGREPPDELQALPCRELVRQGNLVLPGDPGVLALLRGFSGVPQLLALLRV
jgi:hypothetical protein